MHTEEEMREIRCCGPRGCGTLRKTDLEAHPDDAEYQRFCIASKCAAWRWGPGPGKVIPAEKAGEVAFAYNTQSDKGYCGLAR